MKKHIVRGYTYKVAATRTKVPARTIQHYTSLGLIVPGVKEAAGRGTQALYNQENLVQIFVLRQLASYMSLVRARRLLELIIANELWRAWMREMDPVALVDAKVIIYVPLSSEYQVELVASRSVDLMMDGIRNALIINVGLGIDRATGG